MKKYFVVALCCLCVGFLTSSQKTAKTSTYLKSEGLVYDYYSRIRIANVNIRSLVTGFATTSNLKGEFRLKTLPEDTLLISCVGYYNSLKIVKKEPYLMLMMKPRALQLREIVIRDSVQTAEEKYQKIRQTYNDFLRKGQFNIDEALTIERSTIGLSIESIYNYFSKAGQFARRLNRVLEFEQKQLKIDELFNAGLVNKYTGASGEELKMFMQNYRPTQEFALNASEYEMIVYIKNTYKLFKIVPDPLRYPTLFIENAKSITKETSEKNK